MTAGEKLDDLDHDTMSLFELWKYVSGSFLCVALRRCVPGQPRPLPHRFGRATTQLAFIEF